MTLGTHLSPSADARFGTSPIAYRRAVAQDAAALAALGSTVWISTYAEDGVEPVFAHHVLAEFTAERLSSLLDDPHNCHWLAETASGLVGFAELKIGERCPCLAAEAQAEISRLYVLERFTRRGIGRELLCRCRQSAATAGIATLWLTAYEGNTRALEFYRREGWAVAGDHAFALADRTYRNVVLTQPVRVGAAG